MDWLQDLNSKSDDPYVQAGANRWNSPSLSALNDRLAGCTELHLLGQELESQDGEDNTARQWLLDWLNKGNHACLYLIGKLETAPHKMHVRLRDTLRYLYPYVEDGRLVIGQAKGYNLDHLPELPRIFCRPVVGAPAWLSAMPVPPLLEELLPKPVYQTVLDGETVAALEDLIRATKPYPTQALQGGVPIERWELVAGQPRKLAEYFTVLAGAHVQELFIRDPYCAAGEMQTKALLDLLPFLKGHVAQIDSLKVHCREQNQNDKRYRRPERVQMRLREALLAVHPDPAVRVLKYRTN